MTPSELLTWAVRLPMHEVFAARRAIPSEMRALRELQSTGLIEPVRSAGVVGWRLTDAGAAEAFRVIGGER